MDENQIPRQHPFSISNISNIMVVSLVIDENRENSWNFVDSWKFQGKYRFSWKNLNFSWFLTYVNFSLSAKFNRFFIILGGSAWRDQKPRVSSNYWKIAIFQRKSWFSLIFEILGKIDDFKTSVERTGKG